MLLKEIKNMQLENVLQKLNEEEAQTIADKAAKECEELF